MPSIELSIGNTYRRLSNEEAPYDRSGKYRKVHSWTLYVDVLTNGTSTATTNDSRTTKALEDTIDRVIFDLGSTFAGNPYICRCPVPVQLPGSNQRVWRFSTRQTSYGMVKAKIQVHGAGGKTQAFHHTLKCNSRNDTTYEFSEARPPRRLKMVPMPVDQKFGIELECTTDVSLMTICNALPVPCIVAGNYAEGRRPVDTWKIVPDSSIVCNRSMPNCNTFEIVSPILVGGKGLSQIATICNTLKNHSSIIKINKSMGFHVHINVEEYSLKQLIKICQQFIKYEDVMDSFMPPSRRTGSIESNRFFQSNRNAIGTHLSHSQRNRALANCTSLTNLCQLMNGNQSRYYKLNLQNLFTGRQPTLEFRQHSATINYDKISAWVRFCSHFVRDSARLVAPAAFVSQKPQMDQFQALFWYVLKDRALRDFYIQRQQQWQNMDDDDDDDDDDDSNSNSNQDYCCNGCAHGGTCHTRQRVVTGYCF